MVLETLSLFIVFLIWSSDGSGDQRRGTKYAILVEGIMGIFM